MNQIWINTPLKSMEHNTSVRRTETSKAAIEEQICTTSLAFSTTTELDYVLSASSNSAKSLVGLADTWPPLIVNHENPRIGPIAGVIIDEPMLMGEADNLPSIVVVERVPEKVTIKSVTILGKKICTGNVDAADCSQQSSSVSVDATVNPTIHQADDKKTPPPEKKKRGIRPRIKEDDIYKSTPKPPKTPKLPKTPKPTKERRAAPQEKSYAKKKYRSKNKSTEPPTTQDVTDVEELPAKADYNLNEPSTPQDVIGVEQLPVKADVAKKVIFAKRMLEFELEDNNSNCSKASPSDSKLMHVAESSAPCNERFLSTCRGALQLRCKCCSCRMKNIKPVFPKEYKRIRTSIRLAKARRRMLVPAGRVIGEAFKCTWSLTHSLLPATKKRKRITKPNHKAFEQMIQGTSESPLGLQQIDLKQRTPKGSKKKDTVKKEKVPKVTKKQQSATKKEEKDFLKMVDIITKKFEKVSITSKELIIYKTKPKKKVVEVDLDPETLWISSVTQDQEDGSDPVQGTDEAKQKWWGEERKRFWVEEVKVFMDLMRFLLGDRRFSPWKGSIVDSVVGVYLTQNVSDNLSSNAFMSLGARYPVRIPSHDTFDRSVLNLHCDEQLLLGDINEDPCNELDLVNSQGLSQESSQGSCEGTESMNDLHCKDLHIKEGEENVLHRKVEKGCSSSTSSASPQHMDAPQGADMNQTLKNKTKKKGKGVEDVIIDWDLLRRTHSTQYDPKNRDPYTFDSVDWDAVRKADVKDIADAIKERGQNNELAKKIQDFLDRILKDHGSIDLEWLRDVPPKATKEFLLDIYGLGMKSVECLRLLTLRHHAFPVDTNVGRIVIRLGWVPLYHPLEESLQIHLIENYPVMDKIQAYLWPRLCHLNQETLYELHYMLITFGKVFCTKRAPHCNACPLRGRCKYYESKCASMRQALPGVPQEGVKEASKIVAMNPFDAGPSDLALTTQARTCEPIIEEPPSPQLYSSTMVESDIEDLFLEDSEEISYINLCAPPRSSALVALSPGTMPTPRQKFVVKLRTEHQVYELPDSHPLLNDLEKREVDDPCPYLLAIWTQDESQHDGLNLENCNATIPGTLLIPCRTERKGSFPLNGTYFQVNEVFADHETSHNPINVPTAWIWSLEKRTLYCGSTTSAIAKGLSSQQVRDCFWKGFVCVRGIDLKTKAPKRLAGRFHMLKSKKYSKNDEEVSKKTD